MEVKVNHAHSQEVAFSKAKNMMTQLKADWGDKVQDLKEEWSGNSGKYSCSFQGMKLAGTIEVHDKDVVVKGELPFFARLFEGVIRDAITKNLQKALK